MNKIEVAYREHLADGPGVLADAYEFVLPADSADTATNLARALCFEPAQYGYERAPAFGEQYRGMLDHGLRQVALSKEVLTSDAVRGLLPGWFDLELFYKAELVADAGLALIPSEEVETVHNYGPKYSQGYANHPEYGYGMAQTIGVGDAATQTIASFIARHHSVQARNAYGMEWWDIDHDLLDTAQVDLMVMAQKPFDYFDDCFSRASGKGDDYETLVSEPLQKFGQTFGQLLCANLGLIPAMDRNDFNPSLPNRIATEIEETVLADTPIGNVYRSLMAEAITQDA